MDAPLCPGYDVVEMLGFGATGEVWRARDLVTGEEVALKRLRPGGSLADHDRLRREAAVLTGIDHPHVLGLRGVHGDDDSLVLVLDLAAAGSLARLALTRGLLAAGEVVTVAVPLAQALAHVHARGLVHGDVTPANILFTLEGRPVLSDLGMCRLLGLPPTAVGGTPGFLDPAGAATDAGQRPASDVYGLAASCLSVLDVHDEVSAALAGVLGLAMAADPDLRPSAERLAVLVYESATPMPLRLTAGAGRIAGHRPEPAPALTRVSPGRLARPIAVPAVAPRLPRRPRRTRGPRRPLWSLHLGWPRGWQPGWPLVVSAVVAALVPVLLLAQAWLLPGVPPPRRAAHPSWAQVVAGLDQRRATAFARGDGATLRAVYATGAPAGLRDRAALARLTDAGLRAEGLRIQTIAVHAVNAVRAVRVVETVDTVPVSVRLRVTDVLGPYRVLDRHGAVVREAPGRGPRSWLVTLRRERARWRIYEVARG